MKITIVSILVLLALSNSASRRSSGDQVVTSALRQELAHGPTDIFIRFPSTTSTLNAAKSLPFATRAARITATREALISFAETTQKNVTDFLNSRSLQYRQFWISNDLFIAVADVALVAELSAFPEVVSIYENVKYELPKPEHGFPIVNSNTSAEWGVEDIKAHLVWTLPGGGTGEGVRVGTIDTGVRRTHEALRDNYYGEYGWYHPCLGSPEPHDQNGHGTHTMGTIAGSGGIGVAPGAKWMACEGCCTLTCQYSALLGCAQFFFCPHLPDGSKPDCSHAPHLVSNSWGGGRGDQFYDASIDAWHSVGIIPIFSNGNSGPSCNTANSPADSLAGVIGVGSTTSSNSLSSFGSKGPTIFSTLKPDISAPGSSIRSAYYTSDSAYTIMSGTSMAAPHLAGVVALLKGIDPDLDYEEITSLIYETADTDMLPTGQNCGGIPDDSYPNHSVGGSWR